MQLHIQVSPPAFDCKQPCFKATTSDWMPIP